MRQNSVDGDKWFDEVSLICIWKRKLFITTVGYQLHSVLNYGKVFRAMDTFYVRTLQYS